MGDLRKEIAKKIKEIREANNLSVRELAIKMNVTDYKAASGLATALMGEMRSKVNAIITRAGESTKITLTLVLEEKSNFSGWKTASVPASQSAKMYQQYLDEIEKRSLEKKF